MRRRVSLPGADELFRPTHEPEQHRPPPDPDPEPAPDTAHPPGPSGRRRHDEKITVYLSSGELVALEQARLALRADHGLAVDRGRIVREALSVLLADLDVRGGDSLLVRRLRSG